MAALHLRTIDHTVELTREWMRELSKRISAGKIRNVLLRPSRHLREFWLE